MSFWTFCLYAVASFVGGIQQQRRLNARIKWEQEADKIEDAEKKP